MFLYVSLLICTAELCVHHNKNGGGDWMLSNKIGSEFSCEYNDVPTRKLKCLVNMLTECKLFQTTLCVQWIHCDKVGISQIADLLLERERAKLFYIHNFEWKFRWIDVGYETSDECLLKVVTWSRASCWCEALKNGIRSGAEGRRS